MSDRRADLVIRSRRVVLPQGVREACVVVREGRIASVLPFAEAPDADRTVDCGDACLMPGLVDTHVHMNEPGRAEWEGFANATRAAAAGGITTLVDMPLNSTPATTTVAALAAKRAAAAGQCRVDVGFWGGVIPGNSGELERLAAAGVLGFKCFMAPSGVEDFPHVDARDLREAAPILARLGLPLLVHAEMLGPSEHAEQMFEIFGRDHYTAWAGSRPPGCEIRAIRLVLELSENSSCPIHVVHLAAAEALHYFRWARGQALPTSVETCPHYLSFCAEEIGIGSTLFKCAPPIRGRENRERLWEGLRDGTIDLIASDHSPCPPELKRLDTGDFMEAWGGIASLEVSLSAVWTGARERGFTPADLARWMGEAPARLAGLSGRKGVIAPGADADLVVWDADGEWTVEGTKLQHRHPLTPYEGRRLRGVVRSTYLRGTCVFDRDAGEQASERFPRAPIGRSLTRGAVDRADGSR